MIRIAIVALAAAGIAGCSSPTPVDPLAGPIPECSELTGPGRQEYVRLAKDTCDAAGSLQERMGNKGCEIVQRQGSCISKGMFPSPK